jgi:hypothetical protein
MWHVVGALLGLLIAGCGFLVLSRYRAGSPSAKAGFSPHNLSPWMRLWRQHRADQGKQDNWLTRPLLRFHGAHVEVWPPKEPLRRE